MLSPSYLEQDMLLMILVYGVNFHLIFFLFLMFIGGCAGSTACGIKIFRFQLLFLFINNQIKKLIYPNSIFILKYNNQKITDNYMNSVIVFVFAYLFIFILMSMLLSITGLDFLLQFLELQHQYQMLVLD